jgi:hypothetical protein
MHARLRRRSRASFGLLGWIVLERVLTGRVTTDASQHGEVGYRF